MTPDGELTTLYGFCAQNGCPDGYNPRWNLIQANHGDLYGTTTDGELQGGTLFQSYSERHADYNIHILLAESLRRWLRS